MANRKKRIVIWSVSGFIIINIAVLVLIPFMKMWPLVDKHVDFAKVWTAEEFGLNANHFFVETEDGVNISVYEVAVDTPKVVIVCLSGLRNPSVTEFFGHARLFKEKNYSTIMLDMRAHGESYGNRIYVGYKEHLDVKAIVKYIKEEPLYDNVPIVLLGVSMGGATAINSTALIREVDGLISLSAFSSWEEVFCEIMSQSAPSLISQIERPFVYVTTFLKYGRDSFIKPKREIRKLGDRPALLMHSLDDSNVSFANFQRLVANAPDHIETYVKPGDFHLILENFSEPEKDTVYTEKLFQFIEKHFVR